MSSHKGRCKGNRWAENRGFSFSQHRSRKGTWRFVRQTFCKTLVLKSGIISPCTYYLREKKRTFPYRVERIDSETRIKKGKEQKERKGKNRKKAEQCYLHLGYMANMNAPFTQTKSSMALCNNWGGTLCSRWNGPFAGSAGSSKRELPVSS